MSSLSRRYRSAQPDRGEYLPPNLRSFGAAPFGASQRARLSTWLGEAGWPRGHMELAELEGFLVALIAWPVGISSGAWLPLIWGERGWKVPTKIAARAKYEEFVALVVGFVQDLDRQLSTSPRQIQSSVLCGSSGREQVGGLHHWGRGFMTALALDGHGLRVRSPAAGDAVRTIASRTSSSAPLGSHSAAEVLSAVIALMEQRTSRGPLGPLESVVPLDPP